MTVTEVYHKYLTPENLQFHMLRTASLAQLLLAHWTGPAIDEQAVVNACLFHDIAKPMTFDLAKQAQFGMSQQDIERLAQLQERLKKAYGSIEHHATVMICREIGLSQVAISCVDDLEWSNIPRLLQEDTLASLLPIYCDMRIGPKGILPLRERLQELLERVRDDEYEANFQNGQSLEQKLSLYVSLNLHGISSDMIDTALSDLRLQVL